MFGLIMLALNNPSGAEYNNIYQSIVFTKILPCARHFSKCIMFIQYSYEVGTFITHILHMRKWRNRVIKEVNEW